MVRWSWIEGAEWKVYPSRAGGGGARGRRVGGPGDQAGLPGCADAARSRGAVDGVARSRGSDPHSRPARGSRTHRGKTPPGTPPRGTAPCATARLWPSPLHAATPAQGEEATWRDGGDRPSGMGGGRREARCAAITRTHDSRRRRDRRVPRGSAGQVARRRADRRLAHGRVACVPGAASTSGRPSPAHQVPAPPRRDSRITPSRSRPSARSSCPSSGRADTGSGSGSGSGAGASTR